jgi:C1A family cysteine protease
MKYCLKRQEIDDRDLKYVHEASEHLPKKVDLRNLMPPVFDQLKLGSCTANSSVAYLIFLYSNVKELSRLFEYYNARAIECTVQEDSGVSNRDTVKSIKNNGVCEELLMPYDITKFRNPPSEVAIENAKEYIISSYSLVNGLAGIKHALASNKPVILGMKVYESFESDDIKRSGIMTMPEDFEEDLGGHSVLVVGYIDGVNPTESKKGCLIVRNSWGDDWGCKGYFYMPYEYLKDNTFDYWIMNK